MPRALDPLVVYTAEETLLRAESVSRLLADLAGVRVHVSPLLVYPELTWGRLERAFAVLGTEPTTVALCATVELWAGTVADSKLKLRKPVLGAYTRDGVLLYGREANAGDVLFGRYLCGDVIVHHEQRALIAHLKERYATTKKRSQLHKVLSCLRDARLVPAHAGLVRALAESADWAETPDDATPPDLAFVLEVMAAPSFGSAARACGAAKAARPAKARFV